MLLLLLALLNFASARDASSYGPAYVYFTRDGQDFTFAFSIHDSIDQPLYVNEALIMVQVWSDHACNNTKSGVSLQSTLTQDYLVARIVQAGGIKFFVQTEVVLQLVYKSDKSTPFSIVRKWEETQCFVSMLHKLNSQYDFHGTSQDWEVVVLLFLIIIPSIMILLFCCNPGGCFDKCSMCVIRREHSRVPGPTIVSVPTPICSQTHSRSYSCSSISNV